MSFLYCTFIISTPVREQRYDKIREMKLQVIFLIHVPGFTFKVCIFSYLKKYSIYLGITVSERDRQTDNKTSMRKARLRRKKMYHTNGNLKFNFSKAIQVCQTILNVCNTSNSVSKSVMLKKNTCSFFCQSFFITASYIIIYNSLAFELLFWRNVNKLNCEIGIFIYQ